MILVVMDAISDVSRASQIFSAVPRGPPLPDPVDLDELFGFNKAQRIALDEIALETKYFDKNKIFINHVDSYVGKYIISTFSQKRTEKTYPKLEETLIDEPNEAITKEISDIGAKSKGKKDKSSGKSKDGADKGRNKEQKKKKTQNQEKTPTQPKIDAEDDLRKSEKEVQFNTSRLTVAEYYELIETEPGEEREEYLTDKLGKHGKDLKTKPSSLTEQLIPKTTERTIDSNKINHFEFYGTLKNNQVTEEKCYEGVAKILQITEDNPEFLNDLVRCGTIVYIVNEDQEQVLEAFWVLDSLINRIQEMKEDGELNENALPFVILISSFMTWSLTKPLDPKEPELPFIENDYRKRNPHPNFQLLYELEEQVIKFRSNGDLEAVILVCGIPYGYEEDVFGFYFEFGYHSIDLPIFGSGSNIIPVIHVDNIGLILIDIINRRNEIKMPFIFAKDPLSYSLKEVAQAISSYFGSGCCIMMAKPFAFLKNEITQNLYDQLTANVTLESCYPLFDEKEIQWKYESGFVGNMKFAITEYMSAKHLKPLHFIIHGSVNFNDMKNVASKLSEYFRVPYLLIEDVLNDYSNKMQEKLKVMEENDSIAETNKNASLSKTKSFETKRECKEEDAGKDENLEFYKKLKVKSIETSSNITPVQRNWILRETLKKRLYIYHGYILVDFPQTLEEARLLFPQENLISEAVNDDRSVHPNSPDFIIYLNKFQDHIPSSFDINAIHDIEEGSIKDIDTNLDEFPLSAHKYSPDIINDINLPIDMPISETELKHFRESLKDSHDIVKHDNSLIRENIKDQPVIKYLLNYNDTCRLIHCVVTEADSPDTIFQQILEKIEEKDSEENYKANSLYNENQLIMQEEKLIEKHVNKANELELHPYNNGCFEERKHDEGKRLKEAEELTLAVRSHPLLTYLINFAFPTLTNAILEVTAVKPDDPLDFLAEYLFKNNPDGRMLDRRESKTEKDVRNEVKRVPKISSKVCLA